MSNSLLKVEPENTYSFFNKKTGLVETIDVSTGERLMVQKSLEDIFNDKLNKARLIKLETGEEVWIEAGMNLDLLPVTEKFKYSNVMADLICQRIREGETLKNICSSPGFPTYSTLCRWKKQNQEFAELLKEAKKDRAEMFMDDIIDIAQHAKEGSVTKDEAAGFRLAVDGFEKAASAGDPGQFGKAKDQQIRVENLIVIDTGIRVEPKKIEIEVSPIENKIEN